MVVSAPRKKSVCSMQVNDKMRFIGKILFLMMLGMNVIAAFLLLLSAYSPHINPLLHPVWSCLGLFFPVFLLVNFCFLLFWLVFRRYYVLFPILTFLLCWDTVQAYFPINWLDSKAPEDAIKVLSYNTQAFGEKDLHTREHQNAVLEYLQHSDADIICLQEYIWGGKLKKKDIDYALRSYRYKHYHPLAKGLNGLGIYSRYPILSATPIFYDSNRNGSIAYRIKVGNDTLLIVNNHLESNKILKSDVEVYQEMIDTPDSKKLLAGTRKLLGKMSEATAIRARQADEVLKQVRSASERYVVVCGDFNDTPVSYAHRVFHDELDDAFVKTGNGMGFSYNRDRMYVRIDHILTSKSLEVYECTVDNTIDASDHYPIWCYISFQKPQ